MKAPGFGSRKTQYLEDIAILTGGTLVRDGLGMRLEKMDESVLGCSAKVTVSKSSCTIIGDGSQREAVDTRVRQIRTMLDTADVEFDIEKLKERIARLSSGAAVIWVGAQTDTELTEKKLRVDDALCATQAACKEGIVAGGGYTFVKLSKEVELIRHKLDNDAQRIGANIVRKALVYPLELIAENSGVNGAVVLHKILTDESETNLGYNAATGSYEDLIAAGIVDPAKMVRCALESASSVTRTFMLADAIVNKTNTTPDARTKTTGSPTERGALL